MVLLKANQEAYGYLRDGIQVDYTNDEGREIPVRVKFMDFNTPANHDFLARKIFRKFQGDFTFLIVTDREDLDSQIYRNFVNTGTVKESEAAQPANSSQLRDFLSQNKRTVFTLIQKFRYDKGKKYPILYDATQGQREIIVIVDEAHRTQYKSLAENMRVGLPGSHYFAFTGTPLLGAGRKTSQWFGDYVSEYNFTQAIDDESTVALFYEKRVP